MVHKHWYCFTNQRCIVYAGFWGINKKIVPYNRVIDVDMNRNPLRAVLGISAVYLGQQGMGTSRRANVTIVDGLSNEMAEKITDRVSKNMTN